MPSLHLPIREKRKRHGNEVVTRSHDKENQPATKVRTLSLKGEYYPAYYPTTCTGTGKREALYTWISPAHLYIRATDVAHFKQLIDENSWRPWQLNNRHRYSRYDDEDYPTRSGWTPLTHAPSVKNGLCIVCKQHLEVNRKQCARCTARGAHHDCLCIKHSVICFVCEEPIAKNDDSCELCQGQYWHHSCACGEKVGMLIERPETQAMIACRLLKDQRLKALINSKTKDDQYRAEHRGRRKSSIEQEVNDHLNSMW